MKLQGLIEIWVGINQKDAKVQILWAMESSTFFTRELDHQSELGSRKKNLDEFANI